MDVAPLSRRLERRKQHVLPRCQPFSLPVLGSMQPEAVECSVCTEYLYIECYDRVPMLQPHGPPSTRKGDALYVVSPSTWSRPPSTLHGTVPWHSSACRSMRQETRLYRDSFPSFRVSQSRCRFEAWGGERFTFTSYAFIALQLHSLVLIIFTSPRSSNSLV